MATDDLLESIHQIINVKVHLHHSHVTGEVIGYAHDFCNLKVRENKNAISCMVHNFFGFDIYFLLKAWKTKDIKIAGTGLTNESFASIGQLKLRYNEIFSNESGKTSRKFKRGRKTRHSKINSAIFNKDFYKYYHPIKK